MTNSNVLKTVGCAVGLWLATVASAAPVGGAIHALLGLPRYDGATSVDGIGGEARIERDDRAMARVVAGSVGDAFFAQGYAHAQDRLFQMDLYRRLASGEVAALVGPAGIGLDRVHRLYGFDAVAGQVYEQAGDTYRGYLDSYAAGVNAGMRDLAGWPPEYVALAATPEAWSGRDCCLVALFMFIALADDYGSERAMTAIAATAPDELISFLMPDVERFDAPMIGAPWNRDAAAPIPGPDVVDLRSDDGRSGADKPSPVMDVPIEDTLGLVPGSNAWAVSSAKTRSGRAMLANDMHMPLGAPSIWYPMQLEWGGGGWTDEGEPIAQSGRERGQAVGLSLPGMPGMASCSNGSVATGFTNLIADVIDRVAIDVDPDDETRYREGDGFTAFDDRVEIIDVRGANPRAMIIRETAWGPVQGRLADGRPYALAWSPLAAEHVDLMMFEYLFARDVEEAVAIARQAKGPPLNAVFADRNGDVAWAVSGWIPSRRGVDGLRSSSWGAGEGWSGPIDDADRPSVVAPANGMVWTSNNRGAEPAAMDAVGKVFASPTRAFRVRQVLGSKRTFDEEDFLSLQYDVRAQHLDFYQDQLRAAFAGRRSADPAVAWAVRLVTAWRGDASVDSRGHRHLRAFRHWLTRDLVGRMIAEAKTYDPGLRFWPPSDEPVRRILEERPAHLLPSGSSDWDAYLREAFASSLRETLEDDVEDGRSLAIDALWGEVNRLDMRHMLGASVPRELVPLAGLLSMPSHLQEGDEGTVRVARPSFGSSCQFVVQPGAEGDGYLMIPGGISGNPFSVHFRDRHAAWATGRAEPLLVQDAQHTLILRP